MIKWASVKVGDKLWDVRRVRMGRTTATTIRSWEVEIVSIDHAKGEAVVRWNANPSQRIFRRDVEKLRRAPYEAKS